MVHVDESKQTGIPRVAGSARWLLAAFLAVVAGGLLLELGRTSWAAGQGPDELLRVGRGVIVVPSPLSRDSYGVYLVDTDRGRICVYEYQTSAGNLRLLAVRNFTYDLGLEEYNTLPSPREMKDLLRPSPPPEAPAAPSAASQPERDEPAEE